MGMGTHLKRRWIEFYPFRNNIQHGGRRDGAKGKQEMDRQWKQRLCDCLRQPVGIRKEESSGRHRGYEEQRSYLSSYCQ